MANSEIKELLRELLDYRMLDNEELKEESKFKEDLGMDSLDATELFLETENRLKIEFSATEIAACQTVKDAIDLIDSKVNN
jgi:acyl carrier protein